jgi:hypothetical protein
MIGAPASRVKREAFLKVDLMGAVEKRSFNG